MTMKFTVSGKFIASIMPLLKALPKSFDGFNDVAWFVIEKEGVSLRCYSQANSALIIAPIQAKDWEPYVMKAVGIQSARFLNAIHVFAESEDVTVTVDENWVHLQSKARIRLPLRRYEEDFSLIDYLFPSYGSEGVNVSFSPVLIEAIRRLPAAVIGDSESVKFSSIALLPYDDDAMFAVGVTPTGSALISLALPRPEGFEQPLWLPRLTFTFASLLERDSDVSIIHTGRRIVIESPSGIVIAHAAPASGLSPETFRRFIENASKHTKKCTVSAHSFADSVDVATKVLLRNEIVPMRFSLRNGELLLSANDISGALVEESISAVHHEEDEFSVSVNLSLLSPLCKNRGSLLYIGYKDDTSPLIFAAHEGFGLKFGDYASDVIALLMPLRMDEE